MGKSRQTRRTRNPSRSLPVCLIFICLCLAAKAADNLIVYDLIPDFYGFLQIAPEEKESRAELFAKMMLRSHPEVYDRPRIFKTDISSLEQYLAELGPYLPAIKHIHKSLERERPTIQAKFLAAFPNFDPSKARIYLMLSLFRFDGKIPHDNPRMLLLGLDGLAKFHGSKVRVSVILTHELFHIYHFQVNPLPRYQVELYRLIWQEGLATYVSRLLNPEASLADALLDPRLAEEGPKYIPAFAHQLLTELESTDDDTTARYLSYRRGSQIPARMGYLIGYEIARKTATTYPLAELAKLKGYPLLKLMRREIRLLALGKN